MQLGKWLALAAFGMAGSAWGGLFGPDQPHEVTQAIAERCLKQGQYEESWEGMQSALEQAPEGAVKDQLDTRFRKLLFARSWYEFKRQQLDDSFQLAEWAREGASDRLLKAYAEELAKIDIAFGEDHRSKAVSAEIEPDLEQAISQWSEVCRIQGEVGEEALGHKTRLENKRDSLLRDLEQVAQDIAAERWDIAAAALKRVSAADRSLRVRTGELDRRLTDAHYQAAVRDAAAFLASNQFAAAYAKVDEAAAVSPESAKHEPLRTRVQDKFTKATAAAVAEATRTDDRDALTKWSRAYEKFDLLRESDRLSLLVENRNKADQLLATARLQMQNARSEAVAQSLESAKALWPERSDVGQLAANLRTALPMSLVERDLVASRLLDDDGAYGFWTQKGGRAQEAWGAAEYVRAAQRVSETALSTATNHHAAGAVLAALLYGIKARSVATIAGLTGPKTQADQWLLAASKAMDVRPWMVKLAIDVKAKESGSGALNVSDLTAASIRSANPTRHFQVTAGADPAADYRVEVAIEKLAVESKVETSFKSIRYVASVEYDPNPVYMQLQAQLGPAESQVASARAAYNAAQSANLQANINMLGVSQSGNPYQQLSAAGNSLGSSMSVSSARDALDAAIHQRNSIVSQLNQTSQTVERKIYGDHSYAVQTHHRTGAFYATVQMVSRQGQPVGRPSAISDSFSESDSTNEGFAPANLAEDPLHLTSEAEILQRFVGVAMDDIPENIGEKVALIWESRQSEILKEKDPVRRADRLIALTLVAPALTKGIESSLSSDIPHLPSGSIELIKTLLSNAAMPTVQTKM